MPRPLRRPADPLPPAPPDPWPAVEAELRAWRRAHPGASFAEIEDAVEAQVGRMRAHLLGAALRAEAAEDAPPTRPTCPTCGGDLVRRGRHPRTVRIPGDQTLTLERTYWTCPRCGEGVFPPG